MSDALKESSGTAERINEPSNPTHYWRWRMPLTLETLSDVTHVGASDLAAELAHMLDTSGRKIAAPWTTLVPAAASREASVRR